MSKATIEYYDLVERRMKNVQGISGAMNTRLVEAIPAGNNIIGKTINVNAAGVEQFTSINPGVVSLTGSYVEIGGVSFAVSGGDTLRNTAANKPDAAAAHAVIPFCYYFSVDTGIVEVTDGTKWVVI